jgi:hypothetical protein
MATYDHGIYPGANYELQPSYLKANDAQALSPFVGYRLPMGTFGLPTDPRTANQLKAVSDKISTGAKVVEITGIDTNVLDYIPKQHFTEIQRLKKLAGIELTFHGPLVEPTGLNGNAGRWEEQQRVQAERQMINAIDRAHDLDSKGNIVVTFHSSNGLPEPKTVEKDPKTGEEKTTGIFVIDENTGRFGMLPKREEHYLVESDQKTGDYFKQKLTDFNQQNWTRALGGVTLETQRARQVIEVASELAEKAAKINSEVSPTLYTELFAEARDNPQEYSKKIDALREINQRAADDVNHSIAQLNYAEQFARDAYLGLQEQFDQAYEIAKREGKESETFKQLEALRAEISPLLKKYNKDPAQLVKFTEAIEKGVSYLNGIKNPPQVFKPLENFALEKASDTFSNVAFHGYKEYAHKKDSNSAPIISIENPPVGMGLSRGEDLKKLVELAQSKFVDRATSELGLSKEEAKSQAEKLIGVTWDVGHINMLRKHGYSDKDILEQTKKKKSILNTYIFQITLDLNTQNCPWEWETCQ